MKLIEQMSESLINIHLEGLTKEEVMEEMAELFAEDNAINSKTDFIEAVSAREEESSTGIGQEVAVPHGKTDAVLKHSVAFGRAPGGVDWKSHDGSPVKLIFMVAAPAEHQGEEHLQIMQIISRKLREEDFKKQLLEASTEKEVWELLEKI